MVGKKWQCISAFALVASLPSQAMPQAPHPIYIDCKVNTSQEDGEGLFVQRMGFKIDISTSQIYEFDSAKSIYRNICSENASHFTYCNVSPGEFTSVENYNVLKESFEPTGNRNYKMIVIDRTSGRLFGRRLIQIGGEAPSEYWYHGTCQTGIDKTRQRKKF